MGGFEFDIKEEDIVLRLDARLLEASREDVNDLMTCHINSGQEKFAMLILTKDQLVLQFEACRATGYGDVSRNIFEYYLFEVDKMDVKNKPDGEHILIEAKGDSYHFVKEKGDEGGIGVEFMKELELLREMCK